MSQFTDEQLRGILNGKHILVVEDDPDLAPRLERLFSAYVERDVFVRGCLSGEDEGGLDALLCQEPPFDVAVIDIRLPRDKQRLDANRQMHETRSSLQQELVDQPSSGEKAESEELALRRDRIAALDVAMRENIDPDAGLEMIETWVRSMRKTHGDQWRAQTAIVFLTSRIADEVRERAQTAVEHSRWLSKPMTGAEVLQAAAESMVALAAAGG